MVEPLHTVYRERHFLDPATCRRVVQAMHDGAAEDAEVLDEGFARNATIRRATAIDVAPGVLEEIEAALDRRRETLARVFGIALGAREGSGFLRYPEGGFYAPHVDRAHVASWPAAARRAVAVVVFLSGCREDAHDGSFDGGTLRLYPGTGTVDVRPRAGDLVAFRADVLHEVTEVRNGVRDAVVDWFYEADVT
jgi:predicted 2-oxoglutarate/Fe(II)-dependent dioxygenase YbiX